MIYDYQLTRELDHPDEFLKDYTGVLVTDSYQVYHSLEIKRNGLKVADCWVHARWKFAELLKAINDTDGDSIIAAEATKRISHIFHLDNQLDDLPKVKNVPMDNNLAEQAIRPFALGRKNWVNTCSENGAHASTVLYSLVETANANDLNVQFY